MGKMIVVAMSGCCADSSCLPEEKIRVAPG